MASPQEPEDLHLQPPDPSNENTTAAPPNYFDRASAEQSNDSQRQPQEYMFYKGNGFTSKARVQSSNGMQYRLVANFHNHRSKESSMRLYTNHEDSKQTSCLGPLSFSATHNNFQIHTSGSEGSTAPADLLQVRARVGNPHPTSYHFTLPATKLSPARKVAWTKFGDKKFGHTSSLVGYRLTDEVYNTPIATWTLVKGEKYKAVLKWLAAPSNEREEIIILLSFIGAMARLKLKGKDDMRDWPSGRFGAFWFMAVLGTAAVADV